MASPCASASSATRSSAGRRPVVDLAQIRQLQAIADLGRAARSSMYLTREHDRRAGIAGGKVGCRSRPPPRRRWRACRMKRWISAVLRPGFAGSCAGIDRHGVARAWRASRPRNRSSDRRESRRADRRRRRSAATRTCAVFDLIVGADDRYDVVVEEFVEHIADAAIDPFRDRSCRGYWLRRAASRRRFRASCRARVRRDRRSPA